MSGPLAHHTFLLLTRIETSNGSNGYPTSQTSPQMSPLRHSLLTAIDADELLAQMRQLKPREDSQQLVKAVGAAFSSVSVLNASFRRQSPLGTTAESSGVDLLKVGPFFYVLQRDLANPVKQFEHVEPF